MKRLVLSLAAAATATLAVAGFTAADVALGTVVPAAAQSAPGPQGGPGGRNGRQRFGQMLMTLGLTDAQKSRIKSIMAASRAKNKSLTDPQAKRDNMREAFKNVEAVLTPAQKTKLHAERDAAKAQHGGTPSHS